MESLDSADDGPRLTRLSDSADMRVAPADWRRKDALPGHAAKDVHFLVLPAYTRYNDQTPLAPLAGIKGSKRRDLLHFPLGYAQVVSSLKAFSNHRVRVLDPYAAYVDMVDLASWLDSTYTDRGLDDPDYMMIGGMSTTWPVIKRAVEVIKARFPHTKIICGGTVASLHNDLLLKKLGVDLAVCGEAEFVVADLFHNLDDFSAVPGLAYLDDAGNVVRNPSPPPHDLNDIPEPAWEEFDVDEYVTSGQLKHGMRGLPLNTSQGCPYACRFCYVPGGRSLRYLTTDNVVARIARMKEHYDIDYVNFYDDILFVDKDWMKELAEKLIAADLGVIWNCNSRVNLFSASDYPLLKLLKRAGLVRISFGVETGSAKMLKAMGKTGASPKKARETLRLVRRAGIRATGNMILGFPGETPDTIRETVEFCKENLLYPSFYLLQPFPGTDVYDKYVRLQFDEEAYLDLISDYREGERFPINLTEIPDDELMRLRDAAETEMKQFSLGRYMSYYRWELPRHAFVDAYQEMRRKVRGTMFVTP